MDRSGSADATFKILNFVGSTNEPFVSKMARIFHPRDSFVDVDYRSGSGAGLLTRKNEALFGSLLHDRNGIRTSKYI